MRIHSAYIVKQTTRGENTKTALQSVGKCSKAEGAAKMSANAVVNGRYSN